MFQLIKDSFRDFKTDIKKYIVFEGVYTLISSVIFIPLISYIFHLIMRGIGSVSLLNKQVFQIGSNYKGILGLIIIFIVSTIVIFIEYGSLIVISQKKYYGKDVSIADAFLTSVNNIPKIFNFGMIRLTVLFLLIIPFLDIPLPSKMARDVVVPKFVMEAILESNILLILYTIGVILVFYVFLRWIFTIHCVIIEGKDTKNAVVTSLKLTKNRKISILLKLVLLNIVFFTVAFSIVFLVAMTIKVLGKVLNVSLRALPTQLVLIIIASAIAFILTLVVTPINMIFLTRLYYQLREGQEGDIDDTLVVISNRRLNKLELSISNFFKKRNKLGVFLIIIALFAFGFIDAVITKEVIYLGRDIDIAAHKGGGVDAPENSLLGIMGAWQKGADFVEIDVQQSRDGVVVLCHDKSLKQVAGLSSNVMDLSYEELANIDIGSSFSENFRGETIPSLEEVLIAAKDRIKLIVELKPYADDSDSLAKEVVRLIEKYDMVDDCYIQSLNYDALKAVREANEDIKIGQIVIISAGDLSPLDVDFYTIEQTMLSNRLIRDIHSQDREVWVWTINGKKDAMDVLSYNIDGIITDHPDMIKEIITINLDKKTWNIAPSSSRFSLYFNLRDRVFKMCKR